MCREIIMSIWELKGKIYYAFGLEDLILLRFQFPCHLKLSQHDFHSYYKNDSEK